MQESTTIIIVPNYRLQSVSMGFDAHAPVQGSAEDATLRGAGPVTITTLPIMLQDEVLCIRRNRRRNATQCTKPLLAGTAGPTCWLGVQPLQHAAWREKQPGLPAGRMHTTEQKF
jgi:hypothetical protein